MCLGAFEDPHKHRRPHEHGSSSGVQLQQREREYREKKEKERLAQQQHQHGSKAPPMAGQHPSGKQPVPHHYHQRSSDPNKHPRPPVPVQGRQEARDILREATKDIGLRDHRWVVVSGNVGFAY